MTKIEELKAAFEAATPGEWDISRHATPDYYPQHGVYAVEDPAADLAIVFREADGCFICAARELMPQLIEAVELLADLRPIAYARVFEEISDGAVGTNEDLDACHRAAKLLNVLI